MFDWLKKAEAATVDAAHEAWTAVEAVETQAMKVVREFQSTVGGAVKTLADLKTKLESDIDDLKARLQSEIATKEEALKAVIAELEKAASIAPAPMPQPEPEPAPAPVAVEVQPIPPVAPQVTEERIDA